ncbi:hypothetical protein NDU88_003148 [Pleurodeles waltl]|uniref:Uncharacterized protein n=1 Tax=Pleurodeles waltl TaxID=8319 RepID=A0AAV7RDH5_PLEWA|nr:hypothetical protein NDU88_003148 [Pleurodeles waltl]
MLQPCDVASSVDATLGCPGGTSADAHDPRGTSMISYPDPEVFFELAPRDAERLDTAGPYEALTEQEQSAAAATKDGRAEDRRVDCDERKRTPSPAAKPRTW